MRLPPLERLAVLVQHGPTWTLPRSLSREIAAHLIVLFRDVDDTDLTEENIDRMLAEDTPVEICEEPDQTIEEEDDCERARTSVTRAGLTALVAQAIRDAACNGDCHEEEEICMDQRIQPFVWHHGILHEVMGRPEVIAAVTVDAMQEITERRVAAERQSYEKHADILRRARKSHTTRCPVASDTFKRPTWGCSMCDILGITTAEVDDPQERLLHNGRPAHEAVVLADDVAYLLDHLGTQPHAHMTPGIWDTSRKPCHHCARIDLIRTRLTAFEQDDT